jgi:uncharacterized membrane protein
MRPPKPLAWRRHLQERNAKHAKQEEIFENKVWRLFALLAVSIPLLAALIAQLGWPL